MSGLSSLATPSRTTSTTAVSNAPKKTSLTSWALSSSSSSSSSKLSLPLSPTASLLQSAQKPRVASVTVASSPTTSAAPAAVKKNINGESSFIAEADRKPAVTQSSVDKSNKKMDSQRFVDANSVHVTPPSVEHIKREVVASPQTPIVSIPKHDPSPSESSASGISKKRLQDVLPLIEDQTASSPPLAKKKFGDVDAAQSATSVAHETALEPTPSEVDDARQSSSKKRKEPSAETDGADAQENNRDNDMAPPKPKRKYTRKPKLPTHAPSSIDGEVASTENGGEKPKRKYTRKPKPPSDEADVAVEAEHDAASSSNAESATKPKRKYTRKPKENVAGSDNVDGSTQQPPIVDASSAPTPVKRGRGRPRKVPLVQPPAQETDVVVKQGDAQALEAYDMDSPNGGNVSLSASPAHSSLQELAKQAGQRTAVSGEKPKSNLFAKTAVEKTAPKRAPASKKKRQEKCSLELVSYVPSDPKRSVFRRPNVDDNEEDDDAPLDGDLIEDDGVDEDGNASFHCSSSSTGSISDISDSEDNSRVDDDSLIEIADSTTNDEFDAPRTTSEKDEKKHRKRNAPYDLVINTADKLDESNLHFNASSDLWVGNIVEGKRRERRQTRTINVPLLSKKEIAALQQKGQTGPSRGKDVAPVSKAKPVKSDDDLSSGDDSEAESPVVLSDSDLDDDFMYYDLEELSPRARKMARELLKAAAEEDNEEEEEEEEDDEEDEIEDDDEEEGEKDDFDETYPMARRLVRELSKRAAEYKQRKEENGGVEEEDEEEDCLHLDADA